ncbi:hypothetical protein AYR66_12630 [Noviherbaspirillum denitrificans]|uniref:Uncharacterized protein n=1 Tax=Noviherbaspirillum denitrificans TaxID=1968433 RepID=A0A254TCD1_9BURK|nr:hypothetical protein AYR66_12630 [Noviherbaspirillum denitrificans]
MLKAATDHFRHRPEHRAAWKNPRLQQCGQFIKFPFTWPCIRRQRRRIPAEHGNHAAGQVFVRRPAERCAAGMAGAAVSEPLDEVGATVPLRWPIRIRLIAAGREIQRAPEREEDALVVREAQFVLAVRLAHRRERPEVGKHRVRICACDFGVVRIRKRRIEETAILRSSIMDGAPEVVRGPVADAGFIVWRDVGGIDRAERRRNRAPAGVGIAAPDGVAGHAVAGFRQVFAPGDLRGLVGDRRACFVASRFAGDLVAGQREGKGDEEGGGQ